MIYLQCFGIFDSYATMNPITGDVFYYSKKQTPLPKTYPLMGHFATISGKQIFFFRQDDGLHLRIEGEDYPLLDDVKVVLLTQGELNVLRVLKDEAILLDYSYPRPIIDPPINDVLSPLEEEEDYDFGLLIFNVMNDTARKKRIYQMNREV